LSLAEWNERYRSGEQVFETPAPLVEETIARLKPGVALDLACGPGRNALYLAQHGWRVMAVDGSPVAIDRLRDRARQKHFDIDARLADLERGEFEIESSAFDLIVDSYYLQRDLIPAMQRGLRGGGTLIMIVHLAGPDQPDGTPTRAVPGELASYFPGWAVAHSYQGQPREACHTRAVAEIVAVKPFVSR
jgi:tellurite methyltransferase